jgi:hypothetical protein
MATFSLLIPLSPKIHWPFSCSPSGVLEIIGK